MLLKSKATIAGRLWALATAASLCNSGCNLLFTEASIEASIDAATRDAPRDSGGPLPDAACRADDMDCDGVSDGNDNCPKLPNPLQLNEDADQQGDVCDDCVGVAPAQSSDADNDGIGDVCDPAPGKQRVVAKYFVEGGNSFTDATAEGTGTWTLSATTAMSATSTQGEQRVLLGAPINDAQIFLEAGIRNAVTTNPGTVVGFLVAVGTTRIHLLYSANSGRVVIRGDNLIALRAIDLPQAPPANFILRGSVTRLNAPSGARYAVSVSIGNISASWEVDTDAAAPRIGLIADSVAEVGYLAVYANP